MVIHISFSTTDTGSFRVTVIFSVDCKKKTISLVMS